MYRTDQPNPDLPGLQSPHIRGPAGALGRALDRAAAAIREWRRVSRSRRELAMLDEYQLMDFGQSKSQALFESGKSFLRH